MYCFIILDQESKIAVAGLRPRVSQAAFPLEVYPLPFQIREATDIPFLMVPIFPSLQILTSIVTYPFLTLTFLPPFYEDPCEHIETALII